MAPEVLLLRDKFPSGPKADVWSLGMILAEQLLGQSLWPTLNLGQTLRKVLSLLHGNTDTFQRLARETDKLAIFEVSYHELYIYLIDSNNHGFTTNYFFNFCYFIRALGLGFL